MADSVMKKQKDINNFLGRKEHVIHVKIKWKETRNNFVQKLYKIMTEDIQLWSATSKIKYLSNTTDKSVINWFGKFL